MAENILLCLFAEEFRPALPSCPKHQHREHSGTAGNYRHPTAAVVPFSWPHSTLLRTLGGCGCGLRHVNLSWWLPGACSNQEAVLCAYLRRPQLVQTPHHDSPTLPEQVQYLAEN
jgi:hypothetical protein